MSECVETSFSELRCKEVVNSVDGKRMGRIVDVLFNVGNGTVKGIVVPYTRRSLLSKGQDIFIPMKCITKIGEDVILVNLTMNKNGELGCSQTHSPPPPPHNHCPPNDCAGNNCPPIDCCPPPNHCAPPNDCTPPQDCPPPNDCMPPPPQSHCPPKGMPDCDRRCEKCMLFDCAYRWQSL